MQPTWTVPHLAWRAHRGPYLLFAAAHVVTAAIFLLDRTPGTAAAWTGLPLDDAWIHLVYARSFARFDWFAYNPGTPEAGSTSPAWALFLAPLFWIAPLVGAGIVPLVKLAGIAVAWLASVAAYRLTLRLTASPLAAYVAGLVVALDPAMAFAKVSGMEVALAAAAILWLSWSLAEGRLLGAALGLALAPVVRPEAVVACLPAAGALATALIARRTRWGWIAAMLPATLTIGAWVASCLAINGHPLPNTYYVKHYAPMEHIVPNLARMLSILAALPWSYGGAALVLLAAGIWALVGRAPGADRAERAVRLAVVVQPFAYLLAAAWAHDLRYASGFYWYRYIYPAIPLFAVPLAAGVGIFGRAIREACLARHPLVPREMGIAAAATAVLALAVIRWPIVVTEMAERFAENCENIEEMNVAVGRWLAEHVPPDRWIAAGDAGALRFLSDRRTVDLIGLNNHRVLFEGLQPVLADTQPAYYAILANTFRRGIASNPRFQAVHAVRARHYTICDCPGQEEMVVYAPRR